MKEGRKEKEEQKNKNKIRRIRRGGEEDHEKNKE